MRALFLLLLLANLLFVAWTRWVAPPATTIGRATPVAADPQAIRLLREAPLARELASDGTTPAAADNLSLVCVSAGPYVDRPSAEKAAARLSRLGFASRIRPAREEIRVGQWVRLENLATPEDAANALGVVRSAGIADAYVIAEEGAGTIISLGVFADEARARLQTEAWRGPDTACAAQGLRKRLEFAKCRLAQSTVLDLLASVRKTEYQQVSADLRWLTLI